MTIAAHLTGEKPDAIFKEYEKQRPKTAKPSVKVMDDDVEEIYAAYPSRDPGNGNRSLGKSLKDRDRIRRLLSIVPKEKILAAINTELEESHTTGKWLKNFSTFLNNLPDLSGETAESKSIYEK